MMKFITMFGIEINSVTVMFGLILMWVVAAILIELHDIRQRRRAQIEQRVTAMMLAHDTFHADRRPEQSAYDKSEQDNVRHGRRPFIYFEGRI